MGATWKETCFFALDYDVSEDPRFCRGQFPNDEEMVMFFGCSIAIFGGGGGGGRRRRRRRREEMRDGRIGELSLPDQLRRNSALASLAGMQLFSTFAATSDISQ